MKLLVRCIGMVVTLFCSQYSLSATTYALLDTSKTELNKPAMNQEASPQEKTAVKPLSPAKSSGSLSATLEELEKADKAEKMALSKNKKKSRKHARKLNSADHFALLNE